MKLHTILGIMALALPELNLKAEAAPPVPSAAVDVLFATSGDAPMPGAAVVILREKQVVFSKAYGFADLEARVPNTIHTKFNIGSVTKPFTALMVLRLAETRRLSLDDPVSKYVPDLNGGSEMTIRHLLSHTAGLPDFISYETARTQERTSRPGERLDYSNIGYVVLGKILAKVTAKDYQENIQEMILDPLGMSDSGVDHNGLSLTNRAVGYLANGAKFVKASKVDLAGAQEAGALYSTAADMARWISGLVTGRIVSTGTLALATTPVILHSGRVGGYGYGFMTEPYRGLKKYGHGGDISGFNAYFAVFPELQLSIVVLSNLGMQPPGPIPTAGDLVHRIVNLMAGDRLGPEWPTPVALPVDALERYVGYYRLLAPKRITDVGGDTFSIVREENRLFGSGKQGRFELHPDSPNSFYSKAGGARICFPEQKQAPVTNGILTLFGLREYPLVRIP